MRGGAVHLRQGSRGQRLALEASEELIGASAEPAARAARWEYGMTLRTAERSFRHCGAHTAEPQIGQTIPSIPY